MDTLVRQSVEETINSLLDAEADAICNANRYQRGVLTGLIPGQDPTSASC